MNKRIPIHLVFWALIASSLLAVSAQAQPISLTLDAVDFSRLPTVSFRACVEKGGTLVRGLNEGNFTMLENGRPVALTMHCPDPEQKNSVVLVLDNSGSIFAALPKLIEASKRLVDSLAPGDECAIVTFGRTVTVAQTFTTDKVVLHAVLDQMRANGGTPLFDACVIAVDMLGLRSGNRQAVIITDGEDNLSTSTADDVIANAVGKSSTLYTIGFDIPPVYQKLMEKLALQTGGEFFAVSRPSELNSVYERIADLITERCCISEYISASCPDTLRTLTCTVRIGTETGFAQASYRSSARPARAVLVLDVPDALTPLATGMGFVSMLPAPDTALELTVRFTLHYDEALADIPLLPFTLGTVAQNQLVAMTRTAPGVLQVEMRGIKPAMYTNTLMGFPVRALVADSSRWAAFSISDVQIEGCPVMFDVQDDSTLICQCRRALAADAPSIIVVPFGSTTSVPIRITGGLEQTLTMNFSLTFVVDPALRVVEVEPGPVLLPGALSWNLDSSNTLRLASSGPTVPNDTSGILAFLHLRAPTSIAPHEFALQLTQSELWQRCCPESGPKPEVRIIQDGSCSSLAVRPKRAMTVSSAPNPSRSSDGQVIVTVKRDADEGRRIEVTVIDLQGKVMQRVFDGVLLTGSHDFPVDLSAFPSGVYLVIATDGETSATASLICLR
jgi:hypothetical protein